MSKIDYVTIKTKEYKAIKVLIAILVIMNIILCFKGMSLMRKYADLETEKRGLEEIIEIQKTELNKVEKMLEEI